MLRVSSTALLLGGLLSTVGCPLATRPGARARAPAAESPLARACREVLRHQRDAWNRGDLEAFVRAYRRSDDTVFAGPERVALGFEQMVARYRRRYPDRAAMGRLDFSRVELRPLGREHIVARGRWHLSRDTGAGGPIGGAFALVMRDIEGRCRIVVDYTVAS